MISIHALREEGDQCGQLRHQLLQDFYPRPPRGGRRVARMMSPAMIRFLSTPSARRATSACPCSSQTTWNFYPRPPRGGRHYTFGDTPSADAFLSTPSARRATCEPWVQFGPQLISIHALREEGDRGGQAGEQVHTDFYPRPPRGGRPPAYSGAGCWRLYFYPRPPRGGRPASHPSKDNIFEFLSTPSARRATIRSYQATLGQQISIHALREEGDQLREEDRQC